MSDLERYDEIIDLLRKIKRRPGLYLGEPSLTKLKFFLDGYVLGARCESFSSGFNEWIAKKYNILKSYGWHDIILMESASEEEAFDNFFTLLNEYHQEREMDYSL